jgi:hypothetical protein
MMLIARARSFVVEQTEQKGHRPGGDQRGAGTARGPQADQRAGGVHEEHECARRCEAEQAPRQHAASPEAVAERAADEEEGSERQGVRRRDPLQTARACVKVPADRRERDIEHGVVDHLDQHREREGEQRRRGGAKAGGLGS